MRTCTRGTPERRGPPAYVGNSPASGRDPSGLGECYAIVEFTYYLDTGEILSWRILGYEGDCGGGAGSGGGGGGGATPPPQPKPPECSVPSAPPGADINQNIRAAESRRFQALWFYNQVRNRGPWDYKQQGRKYEAFGNFNYGATGTAVGFGTGFLLRMGGWAQLRSGNWQPGSGSPLGGAPYGDDPRDQAQIQHGVNYYDALKAGRCDSKNM